MKIQNKNIRILYRILFLAACLYGLYLNSGLPQGALKLGMLRFYTILSNVLCFVFILACLIYNFRHYHWEDAPPSIWSRIKPAVTLCIIVTFLVYHFVLAKSEFMMASGYKPFSLADILVHYVVPIGMIIDWVLFDDKGNMKRFDPFQWLIIPYIYFIVFMVRGQFGGPMMPDGSKYPYFFIDVDLLGWSQVLINVAALTVGFIILGYAIVVVDHLLAQFKSKRIVN